MMRFDPILTSVLAALCLSLASPAAAQSARPMTAEEALLAIEEAELRERIVTALAIGESIRLRGRTILVAMSEIGRVRRQVERLDPLSDRRGEFEERLKALEARRAELDAQLDDQFLSYLEIVSELSNSIWARLDRVGEEVRQSLTERRIEQLIELYPIVQGHVGEFSRSGGVTRAVTDRWRREIDDTYQMRQDRLRAGPAPEPSLGGGKDKEKDI